MNANKGCPRCDEGKLVEKVSTDTEIDFNKSLIAGLSASVGILPTVRIVRYVTYTCSKSCGYLDIIKRE